MYEWGEAAQRTWRAMCNESDARARERERERERESVFNNSKLDQSFLHTQYEPRSANIPSSFSCSSCESAETDDRVPLRSSSWQNSAASVGHGLRLSKSPVQLTQF